MTLPTTPRAERTLDVTFFEPWRDRQTGQWKPGKAGQAVAYECLSDFAEDVAQALDVRTVSTADAHAQAAASRAGRTLLTKAAAAGRMPSKDEAEHARLVAAIDAVKGGLPAFAPAAFAENVRSKASCERVSIYAADHDVETEASWGAAVEALTSAGLAWFAYGSPKDGIPKAFDAPALHVRRRLVVALSRDVTPGESARLRRAVPALLGLTPDASTVGDESRLFYFGAVDPGERPAPYCEGVPDAPHALDVDALLAVAPPASAPAPSGGGRYAGIALASRRCPPGVAPEAYAVTLAKRLPPAVQGQGGHAALFDAACDLVRGLGLAPAAALEILWRDFNPRCVPPWNAEDAAERRDFERKVSEATENSTREAGYLAPLEAGALESGAGEDAEAVAAPLIFDVTRQGTPRPTHRNVAMAVDAWLGERVRFDEMRGRILCAGIDASLGHFPDGVWSDAHTTALTCLCEAHDLNVSTGTVDRAVALHAHRHAFNPLCDWLTQAASRWDGTARVDRALVTYWGAADTAATRATSRVFLLSLAARGLRPGEKVDMCPILIGEQGIRKSSSLRVLAGGPDMFSDSPLPIGDKDAMQCIRGKWLWELGELASASRRDVQTVKQFLSQSVDTFRESYGRHTVDVPRTCMFVATSNEDEVLRDPTGERRFFPVRVTRIDIDAIERDREQILGEAAARVLGGERHFETDAEKRALRSVREEHRDGDAWEDLIETWIGKRNGEPFTMVDLFDEISGALKTREASLSKADQMRAAGILRRMGYVKRGRSKFGVGGKARIWVRA